MATLQSALPLVRLVMYDQRMTKSELVKLFAEQNDMTIVRSEALVTAVIDAMTNAMMRSERIEIRGFGSMEAREYRGYGGRNPSTGEYVSVKRKKVPFFKVGKELHQRLNK